MGRSSPSPPTSAWSDRRGRAKSSPTATAALWRSTGPRQLFVAHGKPEKGPEVGFQHQPWFGALSRLDLRTGQIDAVATPPDGWQVTSLAYVQAGVLYVSEAWRHRIRGLVVETGEVFDLAGNATSRERWMQTGSLELSTLADVAARLLR